SQRPASHLRVLPRSSRRAGTIGPQRPRFLRSLLASPSARRVLPADGVRAPDAVLTTHFDAAFVHLRRSASFPGRGPPGGPVVRAHHRSRCRPPGPWPRLLPVRGGRALYGGRGAPPVRVAPPARDRGASALLPPAARALRMAAAHACGDAVTAAPVRHPGHLRDLEARGRTLRPARRVRRCALGSGCALAPPRLGDGAVRIAALPPVRGLSVVRASRVRNGTAAGLSRGAGGAAAGHGHASDVSVPRGGRGARTGAGRPPGP